MRTDRRILLISLAIFVALFVFALFVGNVVISVNLLFLGILILTVPYSAYKFFRFKKISGSEKEFPNFLRDVAKSQRAGLTFVQAVQVSAKAEYGTLTHEIHKINKELSWNVPLEKVLKKFSERMSDSKLIVRSLMVIDQANKSGGNIEDTMDSLAINIESLREVQEEKSSVLNQQVLMMYAIFFIFLGISIALIKFLVPLLQTQDMSSGMGIQLFSSNPCFACIGSNDPVCFGCKTFFGIAAGFGFGSPENPSAYYKSLFFTMIILQGFFTGLIAGQISSDSVAAGVKHSLVMLFVGFVTFILVTKLGIV